MAKFWKDALYPGNYRLPDGRLRNYQSSDVTHLARRVKDMVARGLQIPLCWEHQAEAKPTRSPAEQLADRARLNLGFVEDARVSPEGYLEVLCDVPVEEDVKRLPAVRFVSPELCTDWTDGDGTRWPGRSLTHLAVTSRPVQHRQRGFQPAADRLSQSCSAADVERLSLGDYEGLAMPSNTGGVDLAKVISALREKGIPLPEDTTEMNFMDRLYVACVALGSSGEGENENNKYEPEAPAGGTDDLAGVSEETPTMMSMHASLKAYQNRLLAAERKGLERRIRDLVRHGKVSAPIRDKLLGELKTERLSLDAAGELKAGRLLARIEAYEALDGSPFLAERMSLGGIREEPDPDERHAPRSEQEVQDVLSQWDAAMGRRK
jgi:hypothetical protein